MNGEAHVEIERKYDVPENASLPDLRTIATCASTRVVVEHLDAIYFDTPDTRLLSERSVLRRRAGGHDSGWHLKTHTAVGRRELRWPLSTPATVVPDDVRAAVADLSGAAPLTPLARVQTHREASTLLDAEGVPLAEISDDRVDATDLRTGVRRHWREWEAEAAESLTPSQADALLNACGTVLRAAGAQVSPAVSKLARAIGRSSLPKGSRLEAKTAGAVLAPSVQRVLRELLDSEDRIRADAEDAVHRARVRVRTLRTLLDVYAPIFSPRPTAELARHLKRFGRILGQARDAEVSAQFLRLRLSELPLTKADGAVAVTLEAEAGDAPAATALRALWKELDRPRHVTLRQELETALGTPPFGALAVHPAQDALLPCLRLAAAGVLRAEATAAQTDPAQREPALHDVRKAARRLRYAAEAVRGAKLLSPGSLREIIDACKAVQTHLGDHRDDGLLAGRARQEAASTHAAQTHRIWLLLAAHCEDQAQDALDRAEHALHALHTSITRLALG